MLSCCSQAAKVYGLKEEEDGWDTIQEAQNAACTAALYQVHPLAFGFVGLVGVLGMNEVMQAQPKHGLTAVNAKADLRAPICMAPGYDLIRARTDHAAEAWKILYRCHALWCHLAAEYVNAVLCCAAGGRAATVAAADGAVPHPLAVLGGRQGLKPGRRGPGAAGSCQCTQRFHRLHCGCCQGGAWQSSGCSPEHKGSGSEWGRGPRADKAGAAACREGQEGGGGGEQSHAGEAEGL